MNFTEVANSVFFCAQILKILQMHTSWILLIFKFVEWWSVFSQPQLNYVVNRVLDYPAP